MKRFFVIVFLHTFLSCIILAEGTKELRPSVLDYGYIEFDPGFSSFAKYNCPEGSRLYIRICDTSEIVFFGFGGIQSFGVNFLGQSISPDDSVPNGMKLRIKGPDGTIKYAEIPVPDSGQGYITTYTRAFNGPAPVVGASGYNALFFKPDTIGDFFIEFTYSDPTYPNRRFELIDITVATSDSVALKGRVWSKAWQATTGAFQRQFRGKMYVYSDDSITTAIDFNGIQPFTFLIACNQTGCTNTGNVQSDRRSRVGNVLYEQYKIFLNNPDSICFPTGSLGILTNPFNVTGCSPNDFCINVSVNKAAQATIVIDLNGEPGFQQDTTDRLIEYNLVVGDNCIPWDFLDGQGNPVVRGVDIKFILNYNLGITHLPMFDVEDHPFGYKISLIRPSGSDPKVFWDDSNIPQGTTELAGCTSTSGCHSWPFYSGSNSSNAYGNNRTINTWWYAVSIEDSFGFHLAGSEIISRDTNICPNNNFTLYGSPNGETYEWQPLNITDSVTTIKVIDEQILYFTVTDTSTGCSVSDSIRIGLESECAGILNVPEIFTPNGDNYNDLLYVLPNNLKELEVFKIYNRYGNQVFSTNDINIGWDGSYKGKVQEIGNYIYYAKGIGLDNLPVSVQGSVILMR